MVDSVDSPKFIATSENWTNVQIWEEAQFPMLTPTLLVNRAANDPSVFTILMVFSS